jgi:hypothetical protein
VTTAGKLHIPVSRDSLAITIALTASGIADITPKAIDMAEQDRNQIAAHVCHNGIAGSLGSGN